MIVLELRGAGGVRSGLAGVKRIPDTFHRKMTPLLLGVVYALVLSGLLTPLVNLIVR